MASVTVNQTEPAIDTDIFRPTELHVDPESLDYTTWARIGDNLQRLRGWQWWVGDWWNLGDVFGEEKYQAIEDAGIAYRTATQCGWCAGKVPPKLRIHDLEWSYHRASASLPTLKLIGKAIKHANRMVDEPDGWSYRKQERYVKELLAEHEGKTLADDDDDVDGDRTDPSRRAEFKLALFVDRADFEIGLGIQGQLEEQAESLIHAAGLENARVSLSHK